ncbi:ROK family protein, partial [Streptomyces carpinensis]
MHTDLVAALDIGGTKIAGALVDGHGSILVRAQRATPAQEDGDTVMRAVEDVLGDLAATPLWSRATALGIGSAPKPHKPGKSNKPSEEPGKPGGGSPSSRTRSSARGCAAAPRPA